MTSNIVQYLRVGTIETMHLQLKQKEDNLTKRRVEVATLHQACAKYKRARVAPSTIASTIKQAVLPSTTNDADLCSRCEKAKDVFGELEQAVDAFAEKLNATLKEKEGEIEKLGPLWFHFCRKKKKKIHNSSLIIASK